MSQVSDSGMDEEEVGISNKESRRTGAERADAIFSGFDTAVGVAGTVATKIYALALIVLAIIGFMIVPAIWWGAGLVLLYGIYLIFPGDKWVIW